MHCQVWGKDAHLVPVGLEKISRDEKEGKKSPLFLLFMSRAVKLSWDEFFFLNLLSLEGGACNFISYTLHM